MFLFTLHVVIAINTCLASILATNLETVMSASELTLPLFNVVSDIKMFHSDEN